MLYTQLPIFPPPKPVNYVCMYACKLTLYIVLGWGLASIPMEAVQPAGNVRG